MNLMNVLKKSAIGTMAAVITVAGTAVTVPSMNVSAETYGVNELASELKEIANLKTTVLNDFKTANYTQYDSPAEFDVLFVKCKNALITAGGQTIRYTIEPGSEKDQVIDHGIKRFEETVESITNHAIDLVITTIWVDEEVRGNNGFGYNEVKDFLDIPCDSFDSVFWFSGREGMFGGTGKNLTNEFGESYVQPVDVANEISRIRANASVSEEMKYQWTCGCITHEWMHQVEQLAKSVLNDSEFPMCHDYQINGVTYDIDKLQTKKEGNDTYILINDKLKFKYVANKYPDYMGDYYEAWLSGQVINPKDNKKRGMFPSMWQYITKARHLSDDSYVIRNTSTNMYLNKEDVNDNFGASKLTTVSNPDMFSKNLQWQLKYDWNSKNGDAVRLISVADKNQLIRAEKGNNVATAALYQSAWGVSELSNKGFQFTLTPDDGLSYEIQSTLDVFNNCYFRDNGNSGVCIDADTANNGWELTKLGIQTGKYYIKNLGTRGALTTTDNNTTAIEEYSKDNGNVNQEWIIQEVQDGFFTISSAVDGKNLYFDVVNNNGLAGNTVQLYGRNIAYNDAQLFQLRKDANGFYTIVTKRNSDLCVAWNDENKKMELQTINGSNEQTWDLGQTKPASFVQSGNYYYIMTSDQMYLGWNGETVVKTTTPLKWKISDKGNGYYWLEANITAACRFLDVAFSNNQEGNSIRLCTDTTLCADAEGARYAQNWAFVMNADGTFRIVPKLTFARGLKFNNSSAQLSSTPDSFTFVLA
ncbi:RICIN domain-containing protein [Ruminococcus sp.]|uniref:RICIN domain-containing protein n=1 Tax=Ruminococcus sp. TaxID=41978 RepID=UPI0025F3EFCE|nr:RICIN domain-containing protein [Ruminococcus sp.]